MNCNPTLTSAEFKAVHNALCEIRSVYDRMEGAVSEALTERLGAAIKNMEQGLMGAYAQDDQAFETKSDHYGAVQKELGLKSVWSVYEVDNMSVRHPFEGVDRVVYKDHWGEKPVSCSINGLTWAALYVAADACIRDSGDDHHVFIEDFCPAKDDPRTLILSTGS